MARCCPGILSHPTAVVGLFTCVISLGALVAAEQMMPDRDPEHYPLLMGVLAVTILAGFSLLAYGTYDYHENQAALWRIQRMSTQTEIHLDQARPNQI
jgi:hypothetical protein